MSAPKDELEMQFNIFDNTSGEWFEIGPDRDGLELIEIRYHDGRERAPKSSMVFTPKQAQLLHVALGKLLEERQKMLDISAKV